jgi:hypothetical protein
LESEGRYTYIGGGPLLIHQYPLAWNDLRGRFAPEPISPSPLLVVPAIDPRMTFRANYLLNAIIAIQAQRQGFSDKLSRKFPGYSANVWGLNSSDSSGGYIDWGNSLDDPGIDGTVAPSAVAGSLMFTPEVCIPALRTTW